MESSRFKFRVWDNQYQKYFNKDAKISKDGTLYLQYDARLNDDRLTIEMCTGLKDKNGKLIYEGDIVKFDYIWHTEDGGIEKVGYGYINYDEHKGYFIDYHDGDGEPSLEDIFEVIGNIHENTELLK